jgi:hypothetical protein
VGGSSSPSPGFVKDNIADFLANNYRAEQPVNAQLCCANAIGRCVTKVQQIAAKMPGKPGETETLLETEPMTV